MVLIHQVCLPSIARKGYLENAFQACRWTRRQSPTYDFNRAFYISFRRYVYHAILDSTHFMGLVTCCHFLYNLHSFRHLCLSGFLYAIVRALTVALNYR
jgi:hypothetical protein